MVVVLAACGNGVTGAGSTGADLSGRTFVSQAVTEDDAPRELVGETQISVRFHDDGRLTAHAGCNTLTGDLTVTSDVLEIAGVGMTEMGCDPPRHDQDAWLADFLTSSPAWALDGDTLTLRSGTTEIVFLDRQVADPDRPLVGTRWIVDTLIHGEGSDAAASSMAGDTEGGAWLGLADDGTFAASSGCRDYSGSAAVDGATVTFSDTAQTDPICPPELQDVDNLIAAVLGGEVTYEITAGRLTLSQPGAAGLGFHSDN